MKRATQTKIYNFREFINKDKKINYCKKEERN